MTTTTAPETRARVLRALRADLRRNVEQIAGMLILSAIALVLAGTLTDVLIWVAPAWAALSWYRFGRTDTPQAALLRAGLGISRADALRGRVALVGIETLVVVLVAAAGTWLANASGHDTSTSMVVFGSTMEGDIAPPLPSLAVTALMTLLSLTVSGLVVGKECTTRRPGAVMFALSLLSFGGASLLVGWFVSGITLVIALQAATALDLSFAPHIALFAGLWILGLMILLVAALLLLRRRIRAWTRALDAGGEIACGR